jgi:hypothetical protein
MLETGIYSLLAGEATISALVATRITPVRLPIGSPMPALTYRIIGGVGEPTFDTSGMQRRRLQVDSFGDTHLQAAQLRAAVVKFLNGYRGILSDGTVLQNADLLQPQDLDEQYSREFRCMVEFYLYFVFP